MIGLMRRIGGTTKGLPFKGSQTIVKTIILPMLMFGSELWWTGIPAEGEKGPKQKERVNKIEKTLNSARRTAVPMYKTSPNGALQHESGVPGAQTLLEEARERDSLRLGTLPEHHPLIKAYTTSTLDQTKNSVRAKASRSKNRIKNSMEIFGNKDRNPKQQQSKKPDKSWTEKAANAWLGLTQAKP